MAFIDILAETKNSLIKSNQTNLAHAHLYVQEAILDAQKYLTELNKTLADIETAGDSSEVLSDASGRVTLALHDKARKLSNRLK